MTSREGLSPDLLDAAVSMLGRAERLGAVRVLGDSMRPTLGSGDLLAVEFAGERPRRGDLVVYRQADYLTVHRHLGRARFPDGRPCLRTRGDGSIALDPPVAPESVVGRAVAVRRDGRWRRLDGRLARVYAIAVAGHDLAWAALAVLASRTVDRALARLGARSPGRRIAAAADRALLRIADRILFRRVHRAAPPPPGLDGNGGPIGAGASVPPSPLLY